MNNKIKTLKITAVPTSLFKERGCLKSFIVKSLKNYPIKEKTVLAVSSKLFSLAENRILKKSKNRDNLIKKEADYYLGKSAFNHHLTIKEGILLPSSGIDQSNSPTGGDILFPKNPYLSVEKLWRELKHFWSLKNFGVLMTDSHTTPLRQGVTGVSVSHWGFKAVKDCRGKKDLYNRELRVTTINNLDALAAGAVWMMGEGSERRPLVVIEGASLEWRKKSSKREIRISLTKDLYQPLIGPRIKK